MATRGLGLQRRAWDATAALLMVASSPGSAFPAATRSCAAAAQWKTLFARPRSPGVITATSAASTRFSCSSCPG